MTETLPPNPQASQEISDRYEISKHNEIVNDILKHLTTLNTGLLAIISAFSDQVTTLLVSSHQFAGSPSPECIPDVE